MQVQIPHILRNVKDENIIILLGLFKQINRLYGHGIEYHFSATDLRTILGTSGHLQSAVDALEPEVKNIIKLGMFNEDDWSMQYHNGLVIKRRCGLGPKDRACTKKAFYAEIKEERSIMIWSYLQGCLNRNLVTEEEIKHYPKSGLPTYFKPEFIYYDLDKNKPK
jgi:hypothetical protein